MDHFPIGVWLSFRALPALLIGPHSSNVVAEVVLTRIDRALVDRGYANLFRHIDDYKFYAATHAAAEAFLRDLALELRRFDLTLSTRKTRILQMPQPLGTEWVRELKSFRFAYRGKRIRVGTTDFLLDLALKLARNADTSAVLNYALKMVPPRLARSATALCATGRESGSSVPLSRVDSR